MIGIYAALPPDVTPNKGPFSKLLYPKIKKRMEKESKKKKTDLSRKQE